jgi:hypothetical protein
MSTDPIALHACTAETILRTYEERGDSVGLDDIRAGNTLPTGEMADEEMVLQYVGLDDGGAESRTLLAEYGDDGPEVVTHARYAVLRGYYDRLAEHARG